MPPTPQAGQQIAFPPPQYGTQRPPGADSTGGLIPYKNPKALAAYYVGICSGLPCIGNIAGPAAIVLGIQGLKYAKENPVVKGTVHAWIGIIAGSIFTLFWWGLTLTAVLVQMFSK